MSIWKDFVAHLEGEIAQLRKDLKPLEEGTMFIHRGPSSSQLKDVTAEEIAKLRASIKSIEAVLAEARKKML